MQSTAVYNLLLIVVIFAANLPWLTDRFLLLISHSKSAVWRWLEWLIYYGLCAALSALLEYRMTGSLYPQAWEFWVATLCLFAVFALPGFIYHYDLRERLKTKL